MKKTAIYTCIFLFAMSIISCACNNGRNLTGNDRDCHGCIGSAGYSWSTLLKKCIRPFEDGIRLSPVEQESVTYAAYLVFNEDNSMVEVFMPQLEENPVLKRDVIGIDETVWNSTDPGTPVIRKTGGKYELLIDGKVCFRN